jgi:uncharacterized protein
MRRRFSALVVAAMVATTTPALTATAAAQEADDGEIVVSAMRTRGPGGAFDEYVELHNLGGSAVDISGWTLQGCASGSGAPSDRVTVDADTPAIPAGGYFLFVNPSNDHSTVDATPDATYTGGVADGSGAGVQMLDDEGTKVTGVGANDSDCREGEGIGTGFPGASATDFDFLRADDRTRNTGDNATDFEGSPTSDVTPRNSEYDPSAPQPVVAECQDLTVAEGEGGSATQTASDADGTVTEVAITDGAVNGIDLGEPTPATEVGGELSVDLIAGDDLEAGSYEVELTFSNDDEEPQSASCDVTVTVQGDLCEVAVGDVTVINEIQGDGATTPIPGEQVITRGVITADFTSGGDSGVPQGQGLRGFFIEAIDDDRDDDPDTSEGLFVFDPDALLTGEVGDLVHVEGVAGQGPASAGRSVTQVTAANIAVCNESLDPTDRVLPDPAMLPMPVHPDERGEVLGSLESMRVDHPELTVTDFWQLERFGEVFLSSGGVRPNPTNLVSPHDDEAYTALERANAANTILLDDGRSGQNLDPLPYVVPGDTLRIGDQLLDQTFVLHYGFSAWRLQPLDIDELTEEFRTNRTRPRPQTPPDVGGSLTVSAFNVLNYFNADGYFIGDDPETAEGFPTSRGARSPAEFERQTEKIVDAIIRMDADIVGLIEIENDEGEDQAAAALVDAVNTTADDDDLYEYIDTGVIGTDEIKLAYIYKPETVEPAGEYAILDSEVDERFDDTRSRPVLAQTFTELATGESVTVANNHLKSKGSSCGEGDDHPRQGSCNLTRTLAAEAMADWLAEDPTGQDATGNLIIGDLNSYAKEDPIVALLDEGYVDLLDAFAPEGEMPYTYTFSATQGYLDYGLADQELYPFVTGAAAWNINADEVPAIDYLLSGNGRFRTADVAERFYDDSAFRSSDHDPVLVGLDLAPDVVDPVAPTVDDLALSTSAGVAVNGQLVITNPDGGPLTVAYGTPGNGVVTGDNAGAFTYTPAAGFAGTDTFTVTVTEESGLSDTATVTITVQPTTVDPPDEDTFLECPPGTGSGFPDVGASSVHADNIRCGNALGLLEGLRDGRFNPLGSLTRGQAATVIDRIANETGRPIVGDRRSFSDVPASGYVHGDAIERLAGAGVILGFTDGTFRPNAPVTRGQLATLLVRYIESTTGEQLPLGQRFPDVQAGTELDTVLRKAQAAGIFNGTESGEAQPQRTIRRDQAASLFVRSLESLPVAD